MSEWISVKDQLPEPHVNVLVYVTGRFGGTVQFGAMGNPEKYSRGTIIWWRGADWMSEGVSHWMPLPEPPLPETSEMGARQ